MKKIILALLFGLAASGHVSALIVESLEEVPSQFVLEVPAQWREKFAIQTPSNGSVLKDKIQLKGFNKLLTKVLVNGEPVSVREDGRYFKTVTLKHSGPTDLVVTFFTPEGEPVSVVRRVNRLYVPIENGSVASRGTILALNSPFFAASRRAVPMDQSLSRADFAYFLARLTSVEPATEPFIDLPSSHWAAKEVASVTHSHWMAPFADGKFRPDRGVTRIEAIIALVKAKRLPTVSQSGKAAVALPFADVQAKNWTTKYVQSAFKAGWLPDSKTLDLEKVISRKEWLGWMDRIDGVRAVVSLAASVPTHSIDLNAIPVVVTAKIAQAGAAIARANAPKVYVTRFDIPSSSAVPVGVATLTGSVIPPIQVVIGDAAVSPDGAGRFSAKMTIKKGQNQFKVNVDGNESIYVLVGVDGFKDMVKHWMGPVANALRGHGFLAGESTFHPKDGLNRLQVGEWLTSLGLLASTQDDSAVVKFTDVAETSTHFEVLSALVHRGLVAVDGEGRILPNKGLTKGEALVLVTRLDGTSPVEGILPAKVFEDVNKSNALYSTLRSALTAGLVSSSDRFNPEKRITRAEFLSLLSKTNRVKAILSGASAK